jgi:hypothetical protein
MRSTVLFIGVLAIAWVMVGCGDDDDDDNPIAPVPDNSVTLAVMTGNEGELENDDGVKLMISPGTVFTTADSQPGELLFSIEPIQLTATVPTGFQREGGAWQFGPEGITFAQRVRLSLPIPDTTSSYVLGRLNRSTNTWEIVPTLMLAGESDRVYADSKHLSAWSIFSYDDTDPEAPGIVHFSNSDPTRWLSVCVQSYTLAHPSRYPNFDPSGVGTALSAAGHFPGVTSEADAIVPQGTWVFETMRTEPVSSLWSAGPDGWIVLDPVVVDAPGTGPDVPLNPSGWTNVNMDPLWAPCEGEPDFVFGTGSVQVTLTWDPAVDLDLHVIEPSGEEIFFANPGPTASGGQLDRDDICVPGTENIFWSTSAPAGNYEVRVHAFSFCGVSPSSVSFRVRTVVGGNARTFSGSVVDQQTLTVTTFSR